jgi:hypothetical protein
MHFSTAKSMMEPEAISDAISYMSTMNIYIRRQGGYIRFMEVFGLMQPVATRPAVRIACGDGMYILALINEEDLNVIFDFFEIECRNGKGIAGKGIINK